MNPQTPPYLELQARLARILPAEQLIDDPLRRLAYGTDASFYRLIPQLVVVVQNERELLAVLAECRALALPLTFRAAGTSLSGQAITDSVLVKLGDDWRTCDVRPGAGLVRLGPGLIGAAANRHLAPFKRKIGPDPASIDTAMVGGIAANNASGMCCGTKENSYHTLAGMRVVLADGGVLDTEDPASVDAFRRSHAPLLDGLVGIAQRVRANEAFAARIRHKYRMKNTTGYGLNALVDFDDSIDILTHLMIGSEGTLGFMSAITYRTVRDHPDKATALILFHDLETACRAVTALASSPVSAVELMDRASLRSVEDKPGLPPSLKDLGPDAAALLVETRAPSANELMIQVAAIETALLPIPTAEPFRFSDNADECAKLWAVRKGTFPSVGAMRRAGTTVVIEDVAFPVARLAEATLDLQSLLRRHGYDEGIIFGHALEGNLHFVFTQDFGTAAEVERYRRFMDEVCDLVVRKYDGALKAEHGTGRNMAPFVALEWGEEGRALMAEIKRLFDPQGLLNPGVIVNDDPQAHLKDLKPLPAADTLIDKCIECGFCEPKCPSAGLTLSPRQRIVGWREVARLEADDRTAEANEVRALYDYMGIDTCAACGLCATACPVSIETGVLIKSLRTHRASSLAKGVAAGVARNYGAVTAGVRLGLGAANIVHGLAGTDAMQGTLDRARKLAKGRLPKWSPALPRPVRFKPNGAAASNGGMTIVYFPSCAARNMGAQRGDEPNEPMPAAAERLFAKAGLSVVYPKHLDALCCGQPFESKGLMDAAAEKSAELEEALREASDGGRAPIVFDTSPCAYRMKRHLEGRLAIHDVVDFVHDRVLPRVAIEPRATTVAVHPVCSVRKMGSVDKLTAIARRCASEVVTVEDVQCCGFAGEKGFNVPELNEYALRHLKESLPASCSAGYSSSRTCEIGLSEIAGVPYRSIVTLVEACAKAKG
jgi:D-lactate dehydrogenase